MISTSPTQNVGSEKPTMEPAMMLRPMKLSGFKPATKPSGMPSRTAIIVATTASSMVAGILERISSSAGTPNTNERPRSPDNAPLRNAPNCSTSGLSSPSATVARMRSASSACGLTSSSIGLPMA